MILTPGDLQVDRSLLRNKLPEIRNNSRDKLQKMIFILGRCKHDFLPPRTGVSFLKSLQASKCSVMEIHMCRLSQLPDKEEKPLPADKLISGGEEVRQVQGSSWMLSPKPGPPGKCAHNLLETLQAAARSHKDGTRAQW